MIKKLHNSINYKKAFALTACAFAANISQAQTITLYRTSVIVSTYTTVGAAISASLSGDSLVLSPHRFKESNLSVSHSIKLTGTSDTSGISTIDAESTSRCLLINSGDVVLQDMAFVNGKINNGAGGGVCNYGSGALTFDGNSSVSNSSCTGTYANGGGIFSAGQLQLLGNTIVSGNTAEENGGGVYAYSTFVMNGTSKLMNNKTSGSGGGAFSYANGGAAIKGSASIQNNEAVVAGGGMYGVGTLSGNSIISNNKAEFGGGVAAFNDALFMKNNATIDHNTATTSGAGIWLNNSSFYGYDRFHITNNIIPAVTGTLNFGGAVYSVNGSIYMEGGTITHNISPISAIYISYASTSNTATINSCHIYNPKADGNRQAEVKYTPAFSTSTLAFKSDSCWWGSNTINKLVYKAELPATGAITTYVKHSWVLNGGAAIPPTMSSFGLKSKFTMDDGSEIELKRLRSINGLFTATNGSFASANPFIDSANTVGSIYTAPAKTDSISLMAVIDADTFWSSKIGLKGLSIKNNTIASNIKIYPNPATEVLYISNAEVGTQLILFGMDARMVAQLTVSNTVEQLNISQLPAGIYLLQLTELSGEKSTVQVMKR